MHEFTIENMLHLVVSKEIKELLFVVTTSSVILELLDIVHLFIYCLCYFIIITIMSNLTNQEYCDMILMYGKSDGNARAAQRLYQEKFPKRVAPNPRAFQNLCRNLRKHGQFKTKTTTGRTRTDENIYLDEELVRFTHKHPKISSREISSNYGANQAHVWRALSECSTALNPFHLHKA